MTAVRPFLTRFFGMLGLAAVISVAVRLIYATIANVPFETVLQPTLVNVSVVLMVCFFAALPRNSQ